MPEKQHIHPEHDGMSRRRFLQCSSHILVSGCALVLVGCSDSGLPTQPDSQTGAVSTPQTSQTPSQQQPDHADAPAGIEVKMSPPLKQIGGSQEINHPQILNPLNTNEPILLVRVDANTVAANSLICTHKVCAVRYNQQEEWLECPCHGARFDLDGNVLRKPARQPLRHFKATIQGDSIWLQV
ncbi:Rieske 2Fe-2S domain-containing protein [Candidatus Poribacteria bacterium]|nr:Rieske 2Fe-2S domain-containing protein [Candidatus Poribacteria bacterium]